VWVYPYVCLLLEYALTANPTDTFFGLYTDATSASIIYNVSLTFNKALFLFKYIKKKKVEKPCVLHYETKILCVISCVYIRMFLDQFTGEFKGPWSG